MLLAGGHTQNHQQLCITSFKKRSNGMQLEKFQGRKGVSGIRWGPSGATSELHGPGPRCPPPPAWGLGDVLRAPAQAGFPLCTCCWSRGGAPRASPPGDSASSFALRTNREGRKEEGLRGRHRHRVPPPPTHPLQPCSQNLLPCSSPDELRLSTGRPVPHVSVPSPCACLWRELVVHTLLGVLRTDN